MDTYLKFKKTKYVMSWGFFYGVLLVAFGFGLTSAAEQEKPKSWEAVPGPEQLVPQIGPPAVVKEWKRAYPQYQPVGKGDTEAAPDAKPGTPNPPAIHTFGGRTPSSFVFDLSPDEPLEKVIERESQQRSKIKKQQQQFLEERYDLSPQFVEGEP